MHTVISAFFLDTNDIILDKDGKPIYGACLLQGRFRAFMPAEYVAIDSAGNETKQVPFFFNGCGVQDLYAQRSALRVLGFPLVKRVPYGLGIFLRRGLDTQCHKVIERVLQELSLGNEVTLNMYGHGRGGLAALMTAKQLSHIDDSCLSINLVLLNPVPNNWITTTYLDPFEITLTKKLEDLTTCKPLKEVRSLYSAYKLLYVDAPAPILPSYPETTTVVEEVIPVSDYEMTGNEFVMLRVSEFFYQKGVPCAHILVKDESLPNDLSNEEVVNAKYLALYQKMITPEMLALFQSERRRKAHSKDGFCIKVNEIKGKTEGEKTICVNNQHRTLLGGTPENTVIKYSIALNTDLIPRFKRLIAAYPVAWQLLKWACLSLGIVSVIYLTGGFGAIPFMAPVLAKLAALIIVAAPIVGIVLAGLWYGIVKPATFSIISSIVYPDYAMRSNPPVKTLEPSESPATSKLKQQRSGA